MNESVGYTVTINIIITFIVIVFIFITNVLIYYKSNKVSNIIVDSIEKYSGLNDLSKEEINKKLSTIGYNKSYTSCDSTIKADDKNENDCTLIDESTSNDGYCAYYCVSKKDTNKNDEYYYYKVKAKMMINIPILNNIVNASVFSSSENMYNFKGVIEPKPKRPI